MILNDLFARWSSSFVDLEVDLNSRFKSELEKVLGSKALVVLEVDRIKPFAGLSGDHQNIKLRFNGRVVIDGMPDKTAVTAIKETLNRMKLEGAITEGPGFIKITILSPSIQVT